MMDNKINRTAEIVFLRELYYVIKNQESKICL